MFTARERVAPSFLLSFFCRFNYERVSQSKLSAIEAGVSLFLSLSFFFQRRSLNSNFLLPPGGIIFCVCA